MGAALKLLGLALDLWGRFQERRRIIKELEADRLRSVLDAKEKAESIEEAVRRLAPDAVPDGMRRYQRD